MPERVYKKVEITGASPKSIEDAVQTALTRAAKTLRQMRWFEVTEIRGTVDGGDVSQWQVTLKVGFTLEE
ncbi:MAG: dodecin [Planctomycetota bacterium]